MELVLQYKKQIIIGAVSLTVVVGGYLILRPDSGEVSEATSTLEVTSESESGLSSDAARAGQEILSILNELNRLTIDGRVFESPVFKSLVDYTIATTSEPRGRPDPFAPLPFEALSEEKEEE